MLGKGFLGTSVDEICAYAGLSKGSFYHQFENKQDIALAVLDTVYQDLLSSLSKGPHLQVGAPKAKVLSFLNHLKADVQKWWHQGCLLASFAAELAGSEPIIQKRMGQIFDRLSGAVAMTLQPALSADAPGGHELAEHLLAILEGSVVLARAHDDLELIRRALRNYRRYIQTFL